MQEAKKSQYMQAYEAHADAIYRHCFFRIYSKERAEELTQETFLRAWEYLEEGKDVDNLRAFLYRVATNLIIDDVRKKKEQSLETLLENSPALEPRHDGRGEIEEKAFLKEVRAVIESLPEDYRDILVMRYVDDLDVRNIAEALEITPNNASVRLNRATQALKKRIAHEPL